MKTSHPSTATSPKNPLTPLRRTIDGDGVSPRTLVVGAHPEDETIGAGVLISRLARVEVVTLTDGAPHDPRQLRALGFADPVSYGIVRRAEQMEALSLAGISPKRVSNLGFVADEASVGMDEAVRTLALVLRRLRPDVVITHPYEGGHPDHDAAALAVQAACAMLEREGAVAPARVEMTSYHARRGSVRTGRFLPAPVGTRPRGGDEVELAFGPPEAELKRRMFECFTSQGDVLSAFGLRGERFRLAPWYDFTRPPHPGRLYYERCGFGLDEGHEWRTRAGRALDDLRIGAPAQGAQLVH